MSRRGKCCAASVLTNHARGVQPEFHHSGARESAPAQPPVLYELYQEDNLSQRELADRVMIRPSTLTVMLKRLESNGLIQRHPDRCDQRVVRVSLTQEGKEKYRRLVAVRAHLEEISLHAFSAEETVQLVRCSRGCGTT